MITKEDEKYLEMFRELYEDVAYNPNKDGNIISYLAKQIKGSASPIFLGIEPFNELLEKKIITSFSGFRVDFYNSPDKYYQLTEDYKLKGDGIRKGDFNIHCNSAEKGIYDPVDILSETAWEPKGLVYEIIFSECKKNKE